MLCATRRWRIQPSVMSTSTRQVALQLHQMKKAHIITPSAKLSERARSLLLNVRLPDFDQCDARIVTLLLTSATYFGLGSEHPMIQQCLAWSRARCSTVPLEVLPLLIASISKIKDRESTEALEQIAHNVRSQVRFMDAETLVSVVSSLSSANLHRHRLFATIGSRAFTLAQMSCFNGTQSAVIITAIGKARIKNTALCTKIAHPLIYKASARVDHILAATSSLSRMTLQCRKTIFLISKQLIRKAYYMDILQVCTALVCFANIGVYVRYFVRAMTTRAVELIDTFTPATIVLLLKAFQRLQHTNPELLDALAERSMMTVEQFTARQIADTFSVLSHFNMSDKELFDAFAKRLVEKQLWSEIGRAGVVDMILYVMKTNYDSPSLLGGLLKVAEIKAPKMSGRQACITLYCMTTRAWPAAPGVIDVLRKRLLDDIRDVPDNSDMTAMLTTISMTYGVAPPAQKIS